MSRLNRTKYFAYFFSYMLIYPPAYFGTFFLAFFADSSSTTSESFLDKVFIFYAVIVILAGLYILNYLFRRMLKLPRNNKYTWSIFIIHIILTPLTYFLALAIY
ncbi:hypothetical protein D9X91_05050 [Falsibacillus albus]|uniref:Uncharacterized protein n=1 Tax=Falsibacillus albus TaxID=2478915 RepID=A0A3L7K114_9BACI|nr:hypothetical protein D9X91_05050 [Falsibacillus albus]